MTTIFWVIISETYNRTNSYFSFYFFLNINMGNSIQYWNKHEDRLQLSCTPRTERSKRNTNTLTGERAREEDRKKCLCVISVRASFSPNSLCVNSAATITKKEPKTINQTECKPRMCSYRCWMEMVDSIVWPTNTRSSMIRFLLRRSFFPWSCARDTRS